ncbi:MAG: macro domain-containing protein [Promethearchaeota archaeon]
MNKITVNNTIVEILVKDIRNVDFDAIVIPSNTRLLPSGKLRCEVLREAGANVQMECNKIINKVGIIGVGAAVITSAGNLKSKHIIHTVGPQLGQGKEGKKIMLCTWNSLTLADEAGLKSIAFSPVSLENLGFNAKICANVMIPTIKKYLLQKNKNLKHIGIVLTELPEYKDFENVIESYSN